MWRKMVIKKDVEKIELQFNQWPERVFLLGWRQPILENTLIYHSRCLDGPLGQVSCAENEN